MSKIVLIEIFCRESTKVGAHTSRQLRPSLILSRSLAQKKCAWVDELLLKHLELQQRNNGLLQPYPDFPGRCDGGERRECSSFCLCGCYCSGRFGEVDFRPQGNGQDLAISVSASIYLRILILDIDQKQFYW